LIVEYLVLFVVAALAGGIASLSGFGIGSLLTPLLALRMDLQLAVAAVSIPHFLATAVRFFLLRRHLRREILLSFGIWSALGGISGALLHNIAGSPLLIKILATLLVFAGGSGMLSLSEKLKIPAKLSWLAGLLSGLFGGLVGNQGGIRAAALMSFDLPRHEFVAAATAVGLIVDLARMPVYLAWRSADLVPLSLPILIACAGVLVGTWLGKPVLGQLPEKTFRQIVSFTILSLGIWLFIRA